MNTDTFTLRISIVWFFFLHLSNRIESSLTIFLVNNRHWSNTNLLGLYVLSLPFSSHSLFVSSYLSDLRFSLFFFFSRFRFRFRFSSLTAWVIRDCMSIRPSFLHVLHSLSLNPIVRGPRTTIFLFRSNVELMSQFDCIYTIFKHGKFNRPKRGRCLLKKHSHTHTHTR